MDLSTTTVNWHRYAQKYDMLLDYNPFYQKLRALVFSKIKHWDFKESDILIDLGAGTGNYSLPLARQFPLAQVYHIDNNEGMCDLASQKVQNDQVHNLKILRQSVGVTNFKPASISACLCIHSLYTFPNPANVIQRIYHWMKPGGVGIFVDPGRTVNVLDWQLAIGWQMIKQHGLWKTIQLLKEGKEISHQNRQISKLHAEGIYWKHSHEEFCDTVRAAGFTITESAYCFRGISDMVVVEK